VRWFRLKWRDALSVSEYSAHRAGILEAPGSTDPKRIWKQCKQQVPALLFIVAMSPLGYALGMIASPQRPLPFRLARSLLLHQLKRLLASCALRMTWPGDEFLGFS